MSSPAIMIITYVNPWTSSHVTCDMYLLKKDALQPVGGFISENNANINLLW